MYYGFVRVGAAVPDLKVADCIYNGEQIISLMHKAEKLNIQIVCFPELSITGYTCGDLFHQRELLNKSEAQLSGILKKTSKLELIGIIGMPLIVNNELFNCAVVIQKGKILGVIPKVHLPNYGEFYEKRWFSSGKNLTNISIKLCEMQVPFGMDLLFKENKNDEICFGVEICEDLWTPISPSTYLALGGANLIFNLSASNELVGRAEYRKQLIMQHSAKNILGYIYASAGVGESTTDIVFGGHALIAEYGTIIKQSERFKIEEQLIYSEIDIERLVSERIKNKSFMGSKFDREYRFIGFDLQTNKLNSISRKFDLHPFVPSDLETRDARCEEIFHIQTSGLIKRLRATGIEKAVIGISGGLDSTLALLVTVKAFDTLGISRDNIVAITMPGFGTTDETYQNAVNLIKGMSVNLREIDIKALCIQHFKDIGHDENLHDVTYENVQARERTNILMNIANKIGGIVIGTGDLSELALGWCTYNGDHMSMYSVNCGVPKTLVKFLVQWVGDNISEKSTGEILHKIINIPITPELLPPDKSGEIIQKTEDIVGPYELHDFFIYHMVRYGATPKKILFLANEAFNKKYREEEIKKWLKIFLKRFFTQQFKRSCLPDGPKVGTISFSPRGDWRMPSDADVRIWIQELED